MKSGLPDYHCPKCEEHTSIDILAEVWVRLTEEGTDADASGDGSHIWGEDNRARCCDCDYQGFVRDFQRQTEGHSAEVTAALLEALEAQAMADADREASERKGYFERARELRRAALKLAGRPVW